MPSDNKDPSLDILINILENTLESSASEIAEFQKKVNNSQKKDKTLMEKITGMKEQREKELRVVRDFAKQDSRDSTGLTNIAESIWENMNKDDEFLEVLMEKERERVGV
ncbi:hypothetical protein L211DRAFT_883083 [Terfezia boudieri ATCC MYA-4762]|uniref:Uncharacterized protein n=1 Tax=Terfezia boudieri ATCC MYA-4762 TaxID=1051890 RepID=A0A3N4LKP6_9PEZI|nr:hypothetical protein L211DRAFT_883083 [Terfezia boudieri ATCC MYA-4762]